MENVQEIHPYDTKNMSFGARQMWLHILVFLPLKKPKKSFLNLSYIQMSETNMQISEPNMLMDDQYAFGTTVDLGIVFPVTPKFLRLTFCEDRKISKQITVKMTDFVLLALKKT